MHRLGGPTFFGSDRFVGLERVEERLSPVFERPVERTIARLSIEPHSEEADKLPYTPHRLGSRPDLEREMLQMLNHERERLGIGIGIVGGGVHGLMISREFRN